MKKHTITYKQNYLKLLFAIMLCQSAGLIGSFFTFNSVNTWYRTINKPFFNPPAWVFGPVWTILYTLMGISLYFAWNTKKMPLKWFWIQLILNSLWSILFFGLQNPTLAFIEIIILWIAIIFTIRNFWKFNHIAAKLLVPYLAWVSFASILNAAIVFLN